MSDAVYYEGIRPAQFDNFTELRMRATEAELLELTSHPNGVVRCYAFWALTYKANVNLLPIVVAHIVDTATVSTQFGCIQSRERVGDFFIDVVTPQYVDLNSSKLTFAEQAYLDSVLVYTPNMLNAKESAISRIGMDEKSYKRVRELFLTENNQSALIALAKFKQEQDIPLILGNTTRSEDHGEQFCTYRAIAEFPNSAFFPFLKRSLYKAVGEGAWSNEWRELYKAIASYKNANAAHLLKVPFSQTKHEHIRQYHMDFIFQAVLEFHSPIYDDILWAMWENEKEISATAFKLLYPTNPAKAFKLTLKTIENADDFYFLSTGAYNEEGEATENLLAIMLDTIVVRDRPCAIELINKNLREINVHQFATFADKAFEIGDSSCVTALFDRLTTEDNPHIYLKAAEVLIARKDEAVNKRIVEIALTNPALRRDWGGEAFAKLLFDNGIK